MVGMIQNKWIKISNNQKNELRDILLLFYKCIYVEKGELEFKKNTFSMVVGFIYIYATII